MNLFYENRSDLEKRYSNDWNLINALFKQPSGSGYCRLMCILRAAFLLRDRYYGLHQIETSFPNICIARTNGILGYEQHLSEIVSTIGLNAEIRHDSVPMNEIVKANTGVPKKVAIFGIENHALLFEFEEGRFVNYFDPTYGRLGQEKLESLDNRRKVPGSENQMFETIFLW